MFNNISNKLRIFSKIFTGLGIIIGIFMIFIGFAQLELFGWVLIIEGLLIALIAYLIALIIYAFAGLVEDVSEIKKNIINKEIN